MLDIVARTKGLTLDLNGADDGFFLRVLFENVLSFSIERGMDFSN